MSNVSLQKRDLNFFSMTIDAGRSTRKKVIIYVVLFIIYLLLVAGAFFTLELAVKAAQTQIDSYNEYLLSEEVSLKRQQAADKKQEINSLQQFSGSLESFIVHIQGISTISSDYLNKITSAIPHDLYFTNISMTSDQLQIQGVAPSRHLIAEYQNNMEALELFSSIHISNITTVTAASPNEQAGQEGREEPEAAESYSFTMSCQLKDVIEE
ncbi:MAG TPA: PilN domain-containing protein [Clostridiales bacterium]|nr:PilN domain-containing protein [Clostridiales bacterium]